MKKETIEKIICQLQNIQSRPSMYFGSDCDVAATEAFFHGYKAAVFIVTGNDEMPAPAIYKKVTEAMGWRFLTISIVKEMREKKFPDIEIVNELIALEITAWEEFLNQSEN